MKRLYSTLLFLSMLFCCWGSIRASVLPQDTLRDEIYQLYPLGVACGNGDLEEVKQLLSGEEEPMAMSNEYYEFDKRKYCINSAGKFEENE